MDEGGLVVHGEAPVVLVKELDRAERGAVEGGQLGAEPSTRRWIGARAAKRGQARDLPAGTPPRSAARAHEAIGREQVEPSDERRPAPLVLRVGGSFGAARL